MGYKILKILFFLVVFSEVYIWSMSLSISLRDFIIFELGFVVILKNKKLLRKILNNVVVIYESLNFVN